MIFACQHCGGLEPYIIAGVIAGAIAAWGWGTYMLSRLFVKLFVKLLRRK